MKLLLFVIVTLFMAMQGDQAAANDSAAALKTGGLELVKTEGISIESEDLTISKYKITVEYLFKNNTEKEIETIVAFPLPPVVLDDDPDGGYDFNSKDPVGFTLRINGRKASYRIERKKSRDGYSFKYYWSQKFPANQVTRISHEYRPLAGGFFISDPKTHDFFPKGFLESLYSDYCFDAKTKEWLEPALKKQPTIPVSEIKYILTTANNWSGPIKNFKMTIDTESPEDMVSLCFEGITKISPTRYRMSAADYVPRRDLQLLFIQKR